MPFFHVDQRPVRARCEEVLAAVPAAEAPRAEEGRTVARAELRAALRGRRLVPGATAAGLTKLLLTVQRDADADAWRRTIERAIPVRGAVRRTAVVAALLAAAALAWLLGWKALWGAAAIVLVAAWLYLPRVMRYADAVGEVTRMEIAARDADRADDVAVVNALYARARRMIADDRVPARVGFRLAQVLRAAASATPFPAELLRELRQLHAIAPETELTYADVDETIERRLQLRITNLGASIHRALDAGEDAAPLRAELREAARTAPGVTGARAEQARLLRELAGTAPSASLLDEIEELVVLLEGIDSRRARQRDGVPGELAAALDALAAWAAPPMTERVRELAARAAALGAPDPGAPPRRRRKPR